MVCRLKIMQTPGSRIPPFQAATVAGDLYKPCACLRSYYGILVDTLSTTVQRRRAMKPLPASPDKAFNGEF